MSGRRATIPHLTLLVIATALTARATTARAEPAELRDGHGIHVESVEQLDPRQLDVHVSTAALQRPVDVRILLPLTRHQRPAV